MQLKRLALQKLTGWAESASRKPLILTGPRQSGKTWLLKELGRAAFRNTAYFDFARQPEILEVFRSTRDPGTILNGLRLLSRTPIEPGRTLIVLDEIQLSETALGALKYFAEEAPEYAVAASGSLLGVEVRKKGLFVPVGQAELMRLSPLSFREFLLNAAPRLHDFADSIAEPAPVPEALFPELERLYRTYLCIGGMPAAVSLFLDGRSMEEIDEALRNILGLYRLDFSQYASPAENNRISVLWNAIPRELAKPNSRFFLSHAARGARNREYAAAFQWLGDSGLVQQVFRASAPKLPLKAYQEPEIFKIYACDVGLLRALSGLSPQSLLADSPGLAEFKGALAENFTAVSLRSQLGASPFYWASGATAEVDFLFERGPTVIPAEVKAGKSLAGKSLSVYRQKFAPPLALRFSMRNLALQDGLLNVPLPLADWALKWSDRLLGKAGSQAAA